MAAHLSEAEARRLGLIDKAPARMTRRTASGPYLTRCVTCGETFGTVRAEDRHLAETSHPTYEIPLED